MKLKDFYEAEIEYKGIETEIWKLEKFETEFKKWFPTVFQEEGIGYRTENFRIEEIIRKLLTEINLAIRKYKEMLQKIEI